MSIQNSSSGSSTNTVEVADLRQHKWEWLGLVSAKPEGWDYGYVINGKSIGTTRETLINRVKNGGELSLVWTPDNPEPVSPEKVPFLLDAFRGNVRREARNAIGFGAAFVGVAILFAVGLQEWSLIYRSFFFVIGAVVVAEGIWQYARSRHYTQEDALNDASAARFGAWLEKTKVSGYTFILAAFMVVVMVVQSFVDDPIKIAGLVKPAVWDGEIWRLFTATLMHANLPHFWMNSMALIHFSKMVEQTVQRACVPLVFLITAAVGSVFSVLLYPNSTSVGASGGLMGLLGFVTIAARFDKTRYPPKYFRRMIEAIVSVGVLGLIGFAFIDNAAHAGGLVGGLLLGWFLLRRNEQWIKEKERLFNLAGLASLLVLGFIAAFAVYRMVL